MKKTSLNSKIIPRKIENQVLKFLHDREIIAIRGPRQSGKSTLLKKVAKTLSTQKTVFVDFEDELELEKFTTSPKEFVEFYLHPNKRTFFFFDEYQYVPKGGKILKLLYDTFPQAKFFITGSSTLDLQEIGRYLVGRVVFFELFPFDFEEFLRAKDEALYKEYLKKRFDFNSVSPPKSLFLKELNRALFEYIRFGGYPRIVLEKDIEEKKILLKNLFTTYVEKDVVKLYGVREKHKVLTLLKALAGTVGQIINYSELSQITNLSFHELKSLLSLLQDTFIVKKITPFRKNLITELKKNPKFYFYDTGMLNLLKSSLDSFEITGALLENYIFVRFKKDLNFWRTTAKAEVDFVLKKEEEVIPIEAKLTPKITRSLLSFIKTYSPSKALVVNLSESKSFVRKKTRVLFLPASLL